MFKNQYLFMYSNNIDLLKLNLNFSLGLKDNKVVEWKIDLIVQFKKKIVLKTYI